MKRVGLATAAFVAAVASLVGLTVPPARLARPNAAPDGTIAGILHVHTTRSDGRGTPDQVAAAAARAGLRFVVFTDHGDATRVPDPPMYRSGVLCLDGVEISTTGGHYVAIGLPGAAPYPLGGEPRDVVEDVRRLGGFGIVAHPTSPKASLRWTDWSAPVDGVEVLNLDTAWRARVRQPGWRARLGLLAAVLDYPVRPPETIARMLPGTSALDRWAPLTPRRRVVITAGADAHGRLRLGGDDPRSGGLGLPLPDYDATFRALSVHLRPDRPLIGNAATDAAVLLRALRGGHLYVAVDGLATPPSFLLTASNALGTVHAGDTLGVGGPVTLHVRSNAPPAYTTIVWNGATEMVRRRSADFTVDVPAGPGVFWVEIRADNQPVPAPWLISNPVYVRSSEMPPAAAEPAVTSSAPLFDGATTEQWRIEHDATSVGVRDLGAELGGGAVLRLRFGLANGEPGGQYVALVRDVPSGVDGDRLTFTARAERPMRVSVQVRAPDGPGGAERWQRSVYLDTFEQDHVVFLDDMTPIGRTDAPRPDADAVRSVLFVIDTTNTKPGTSGRLWISRAAAAR